MTAPDNAPAIVAPSDHATDISFGEILCNSWQPLALVWLKTLKTRHDSFCKTGLLGPVRPPRQLLKPDLKNLLHFAGARL